MKVWTDRGESAWSDWSFWEVGLADTGDWSARWIGPHEPERAPAGERPAHQLRHGFTLDGPAVRARTYASAHGLYELFLNGKRVGDLELMPGSTAYRSQLDVQTYDVTDLLVPGPNVLGAVLSDGWWRGKVGFTREIDCFGEDLALLVQLEAELEGGTRVTHGTGPGWTTATGEIIAADLIDGQAVDLRRRQDGWDRADFDDSSVGRVPGGRRLLRRPHRPPPRRPSAGSRNWPRSRSSASPRVPTSSTSGRTSTAGSACRTSARTAPRRRSSTVSCSTRQVR